MDDEFAELKRLAYSSAGAEADAAQQQLALLEQERVDESWLVENLALEAPERHAPSARTVAGLVALTALALALGTVSALTPRPSLDVFDRPATARDSSALMSMFGDAQSMRWLGSRDNLDVYGFTDHYGGVCLGVIADGRAAASCSPLDAFTEWGIAIETGQFMDDATTGTTVAWGPLGGVQFVGR